MLNLAELKLCWSIETIFVGVKSVAGRRGGRIAMRPYGNANAGGETNKVRCGPVGALYDVVKMAA